METNANTNTKPNSIKVSSIKAANLAAPAGTKFIQTHSIMDDSGTGGICGFYATPQQEREYNDGMARLAEWG